MLHFIHHQGNANWNSNETPRYTCQNSKIQNTDTAKCWRGCGAAGTLVRRRRIKVAQPPWKTVWWFLPKRDTLLPYDPAIELKWSKTLVTHKNPHAEVHSSFIHNCQNLGATKMSSSRWMDQPTGTFRQQIIIQSKKEWATKPWDDMEGPSMYMTEWKKPIWKRYCMLYDHNHMTI